MKKIISTLLALSVCATAITACSTAPASTATPTTKPVAATQSPTSAPSVGATGGPSGAPAMGMGGGVDKSSDTALQTMISSVKDKFKQFTYTDATTGKTLPYNLFIPANYDASKSYPLVLFIADSSVVGKEVTAPLTQGYGGIIWATDAEQAKHASFVLVPEYPQVIIDDHSGFTLTDYVEITARLLNSVTSAYNIDKNRLYATGQSMGCMTLLVLSAKYPDLFAAEFFVSGQWDITTLGNLAKEKFFYIAAEGDDKASAGQAEVKTMLQTAGVKFSAATWDATWSSEQFSAAVKTMLADGNNINFATFKKGSVLPAGASAGASEHMYSFDYAYKIESVRDWLFKQTK